ncbi:40S ribosomal protein S10-B [Elsinoe fawcettii]|nr:40S ribosomal protein S10-B [Elsinoe fawcettii]
MRKTSLGRTKSAAKPFSGLTSTSRPRALASKIFWLFELQTLLLRHLHTFIEPGPATTVKMLIPKADRKKIHEYLFREGVLTAKKEYEGQHGELELRNLYVVKACQSLTSRGYLKTQFSWQWYYYTLTPEGLDYLREWLHLPSEIVPQTHIKQQRSHAPPRGMMGGDERERRPGGRGGPRGGDRGEYRRRDQGEGGKEGGAPGEFAPQFRGGFGRGRGAPPPSS